MKYLILTLTIFLNFSNPALSKTDDVVLKVNGMTCVPCVETVQKVFNKEDSVNNTVADLETGIVKIDVKDNATLENAKIKELIEWGGYDLVSIERPE